MEVSVQIPEQIAGQLGESPEAMGQKMLELYALDGYRNEQLSHYQVQILLGLKSWSETEDFLRCHAASLHYDNADLKEDLLTWETIRNK